MTAKNTPPSDAQILAAIKDAALPDCVFMGQLIAGTQDIRRACRATVSEIVRVARASGWTVDCDDKILTRVAA
jgi:hypothetical protein